jgi:hypothetical protein
MPVAAKPAKTVLPLGAGETYTAPVAALGVVMLASDSWRIVLFVAAAGCIAAAASAQNVILDAPGFLPPKKSAPPPAPRAPPAVWPRLDPGAVLCRTADDLDRHAANLTARVSGGSTIPADCRIVAQPTGVEILSREGLGRTQVRLTGNVTGWTNVWLPEKAPPGR